MIFKISCLKTSGPCPRGNLCFGALRPWHSDGPGFLRSHGGCACRDRVAWHIFLIYWYLDCLVPVECGSCVPEESEWHPILLHFIRLDLSADIPRMPHYSRVLFHWHFSMRLKCTYRNMSTILRFWRHWPPTHQSSLRRAQIPQARRGDRLEDDTEMVLGRLLTREVQLCRTQDVKDNHYRLEHTRGGLKSKTCKKNQKRQENNVKDIHLCIYAPQHARHFFSFAPGSSLHEQHVLPRHLHGSCVLSGFQKQCCDVSTLENLKHVK